MEFSFDFLVDLFSSFYEFFMRIATFLQQTPDALSLAITPPGNTIYWTFYNPFTQSTVLSELQGSEVLRAFLVYMDDIAGLGLIPLWQGILIQLSTIWFIIMVIKVIRNIIGF